jgi:outer membrane protein OmpA-like peptidoglycan-associated protein
MRNERSMSLRVLACSVIAGFAFQASAGADEVAPRAQPGAVKRFVGCPIYRDTDAGRKSGCWLTGDPADGLHYDVTQGRIKPMLGRRVLIEGVVAGKDDELCGGVTLEPVNVSVLPGACKEFLIPAEGYPGRRFVLPAENMQPSTVPRELPPPPYTAREFAIEFELGSDFLVYQYAEMIIEKAALYARASKPRRITITGYAATDPFVVSGETFQEALAVAEARARMIAEALTRLGVPRDILELKWRAAPSEGFADATTLRESGKRRAVIRIAP